VSGYCAISPGHPIHEAYHAAEHGFPSRDERVLFERLCMEIMQAGLSWSLVLQRRPTMRAAFAEYDVDRVAAFGEDDVARLLADPGIVRNRLKIEAAIFNARRIRELRASHGSFHNWLMAHHPLPLEEWTACSGAISVLRARLSSRSS